MKSRNWTNPPHHEANPDAHRDADDAADADADDGCRDMGRDPPGPAALGGDLGRFEENIDQPHGHGIGRRQARRAEPLGEPPPGAQDDQKAVGLADVKAYASQTDQGAAGRSGRGTARRPGPSSYAGSRTRTRVRPTRRPRGRSARHRRSCKSSHGTRPARAARRPWASRRKPRPEPRESPQPRRP